MRKRLWTVATIISALALLGTAAGAANSGVDPISFGADNLRSNVSSNVVSTEVVQATEANETDANETEADNDDDNPVISASTHSAPSGTSSARPGWGCGDTNHEHSGPPGRPGASPPPGCDKAGGPHSGSNSNGASHQTTSPSLNSHGKDKGK
jgi:hypothetical protein